MILLASLVGVLLLSCSFLVVLLLMVMILVVHIKNWYEKRDREAERKFIDLKERIDDTQRLFRNEVLNLIERFDKLLTGIEKKK